MKWIKASERLPDSVGWKITRNVPDDYNSVGVVFFHDGNWLDDSTNGANNLADGIFPTFEWLDESPASPLPQGAEETVWTDELVLMLADLAHHNGYHRLPQKVTELFDEVKKQASGSGYKFSDRIKNHVKPHQP